ncbi:hypothetical protein ABMA28_012901 [Loxostege sticticalis]|uniref:Transposase n=1 Tax=Loxostege sticticalis TaxID=481309 RepID=A0ABD0S2Z1_LOXSC
MIAIYDEEGSEVVEEDFLAPDAHDVYERPEASDVCARDRRGRVRRGGRSSRRLIRGRRGVGERWTLGDPLQFVYTTEADVPSELAQMVRDLKMRQERVDMERIARTVRRVEESENDQEDHGFLLLGEQNRFDWSPMDTFRGQEEVFQPKRTGSVWCHTSAYGAFRAYWDDDILKHIVDQTNQHAAKISSAVFQSEWYPTNADEILCLFAFWMMLGVVRMPTIKSCFSLDPVLKTEVFRRILSQRRYVALTRALHFVDADPDDATNNPAVNPDRLNLLSPILDHLNSKFQENYILSKDICIDESLLLWKGRLNIKQYIKSKAAKLGIKTYELCESTTGYLWSFLVDTGKQSSSDSLSPFVLKSTSVVLKLIDPLLNKGYRLFMDNGYNSPALARYLKLNKTDCVGTLRPTRKDVPVLLTEAPLKQGQFMARHSGDVCVLTWQDKKRISMLSTCHGAHTALSRVFSKPPNYPEQFKPQMVLDYNKLMGGVDLKDQMLEPYLIERQRCGKWYMKLFKRLLNCSILNARILVESSSNATRDQLAFRLQLVDGILAKHLSRCPSREHRSPTKRNSLPSLIIPHSHWPVHTEQTAYDSERNRQTRRRCVVCLKNGRKTQKTAFMCETCKVPLCVVNCFKSFHAVNT